MNDQAARESELRASTTDMNQTVSYRQERYELRDRPSRVRGEESGAEGCEGGERTGEYGCGGSGEVLGHDGDLADSVQRVEDGTSGRAASQVTGLGSSGAQFSDFMEGQMLLMREQERIRREAEDRREERRLNEQRERWAREDKLREETDRARANWEAAQQRMAVEHAERESERRKESKTSSNQFNALPCMGERDDIESYLEKFEMHMKMQGSRERMGIKLGWWVGT